MTQATVKGIEEFSQLKDSFCFLGNHQWIQVMLGIKHQSLHSYVHIKGLGNFGT